MTLADVKEYLDEIERAVAVSDDEVAHSAEDNLYVDVLTAIAAGATNATELASEALKAADIKFCRWRA